MATPSWSSELPSNTLLDTLDERITLIENPQGTQREPIYLTVTDPDLYSSTETNQFKTNVETYSDNQHFYIKSNGLAQTPWIGVPTGYDRYTPEAKSYVFKIPRGRPFDDVVEFPFQTFLFIGVAIDGVPFRSPNSGRNATIGTAIYTENNVIYPAQVDPIDDSTLPFTDGSGIIDFDRMFYYQTNPKKLNARHPNGHSKILGYAFDGNPIYGPYGYTNKIGGSVSIMETSYRITDIQRVNGTLPDGSYIDDFVYEPGLGDLDQFNGRDCITPDYPAGTYAYFVTVDPENINLPRYPYILGPTYRNVPIIVQTTGIMNGNFVFPKTINLEVISGKLPDGLRLQDHSIVGTPYEVVDNTEFRFVIRASNRYYDLITDTLIDGISDRTFSIIIQGHDAPRWSTPAGDLPVGTIGERTLSLTKKTRQVGNTSDHILRMISVGGIKRGSIVSIDSPIYKKSVQSNTKVTDIDLSNKIVYLSKSLIGNVPSNTSIIFTYQESHTNLYILDNSFVDYQLAASDDDVAAGQVLSYYVPPRGGELPPGITISPSGRLTGITNPILSTEPVGDSGFYDTALFDKYPFDFGQRPTNGYESFLYDNQTFDYSDPVRTPKKLNRYYEFKVRVSDGTYYEDRKFRIFVVGDDHFRADNTIIHSASNVYTADASYLRTPIWITDPYLGRHRAKNYLTVFLDVYDPATLQGTIGYVLTQYNPDGSLSKLPPGMILDQLSGEIYGEVPGQFAITKNYKFTVKAIRYDPVSDTSIKRTVLAKSVIKQTVIKLDSVFNIRLGSQMTSVSSTQYVVDGTIVTNVDTIKKTITINPGISIDTPAGTDFIFTFVTNSDRTFNIDIIGEIDSVIRFITAADLGTINANYTSTLAVEAVTSVANAILTYTLVPAAGEKLPPGLRLEIDGTIQGKVNQFATDLLPGLTTFDNNATMFDNQETSIDRDYTFTIEAKDQFNQSALTKKFKVSIVTPNKLLYSNIYVKPFMKASKRFEISTFFNDPNIFTPSKIYRASDPEFGVQNELKMLLYPGIETRTAAEYVSAFSRSSKKTFRIGKIKKAIAKIPATNTVLYELIYLEIIDNLEKDIIGNDQTYTVSVQENLAVKNQSYRTKINQGRRDIIDSDYTDNNITQMNGDFLPRIMMQDRVLSADYFYQKVSDVDKKIFGNSITNIRRNISGIGDTERNYMPLWMRTPQSFSGVEQGFTKAIPICYCLPGEADYIMLNIKNSGFKFNMIDFTVDRAIIDSVTGESGDKYIAFPAREVING